MSARSIGTRAWVQLCSLLLAAALLAGCAPLAAGPVEAAPHRSPGGSGGESVEAGGSGDTAAGVPAGMRRYAAQGDLELYAADSGENSGEFCLRHARTGLIWYSNPPGRGEDTSAKGSAKFEMFSQLVLGGYDKDTFTEKSVNSYIGAKKGEQVTVTAQRDGFKAVYTFADDQVTVPLYVTLRADHLEVRCPPAEIREEGAFRLLRLQVCPYMGSGGTADEGYLVVPDGPGALIRFNNGKTTAARFSMPVYGEDPSLAGEMKRYYTKNASLPVFGISRSGTGLLGVVAAGEANASIDAQVSGQRNAQNTAYAHFSLRNRDRVIVGESSQKQTKEVVKIDEAHWLADNCTVRYYPLDPGKASYSDMAALYREKVVAQGARKTLAAAPPLYAAVYGGMYKKKTVFGLTFDAYEVLTGYADVAAMRAAFAASGIPDTVFLYDQWSQDQAKNKMMSRFKPAGALGKAAALRELAAGGPLYLSFSPLHAAGGGNGFSSFFDAAKRLSREPVRVYRYQLSMQYKDTSLPAAFLPTMASLDKMAGRYLDAFRQAESGGLYLTDLASTLYTNFDAGKYSSRADMVEHLTALLDGYDGPVAMQAPNAYALPYAQDVVALPRNTSRYDVEDIRIPFYALAVSGVKDYALEPVNLSSNPRRAFLETLEAGASLCYVFIQNDASVLKESTLNHLYGASYDTWRAEAAAAQQELAGVYERLGSRTIAAHEWLADGVAKATYTSGKSVIVNYSGAPAETAYGPVEADGYIVV